MDVLSLREACSTHTRDEDVHDDLVTLQRCQHQCSVAALILPAGEGGVVRGRGVGGAYSLTLR